MTNNTDSEINYPYHSKIKLSLNIAFSEARCGVFLSPRIDSSYTEDEWYELSDEEREGWVEGKAKEWVIGFIDLSWDLQA